MAKYKELNIGQIEAVVNKLGGMDGLERFLSNKTTVVSVDFEVWMTIKLGTFKTVADLPKNMGPYKGDNPVILSLPNFQLAQEEIEVDLVRCTPFEFGFKKGTTLERLYAHALQCGFEICPAEVGPQLHLQTLDRGLGHISIGMCPIMERQFAVGFQVGANFEGPYLSTWSGTSGSVCTKDEHWVFIKPRE